VDISSVTARQWGSSSLRGAVRRLGLDGKSVHVASVVIKKPEWLSLHLYGLPNASRDDLESEFRLVIPAMPGQSWQPRRTAGLTVSWGEFAPPDAPKSILAWFATDGFVAHLVGPSEEALVRIIEQLAPKLAEAD
jgi:hypothetical protein